MRHTCRQLWPRLWSCQLREPVTINWRGTRSLSTSEVLDALGVAVPYISFIGILGLWGFDMTPVARWRARRIAAKPWIGVQLRTEESYRQNQQMSEAISTHLRNFSVGVHVLCAPGGAGKTTELARCIQRAVNDDCGRDCRQDDVFYEPVTGVVAISPGTMMGSTPPAWMEIADKFLEWRRLPMRAKSPVTSAFQGVLATRHRIEDVIPQGTILVIDNYDSMHSEAAKEEVKALAQRGVETRKFKTFVVVQSPALATAIHSWNENRKIKILQPGTGCTFAMSTEDAADMARVLARYDHVPESRHAMFVEDAQRARAPGFIVESAKEYSRQSIPDSVRDTAKDTAALWGAWSQAKSRWKA